MSHKVTGFLIMNVCIITLPKTHGCVCGSRWEVSLFPCTPPPHELSPAEQNGHCPQPGAFVSLWFFPWGDERGIHTLPGGKWGHASSEGHICHLVSEKLPEQHKVATCISGSRSRIGPRRRRSAGKPSISSRREARRNPWDSGGPGRSQRTPEPLVPELEIAV